MRPCGDAGRAALARSPWERAHASLPCCAHTLASRVALHHATGLSVHRAMAAVHGHSSQRQRQPLGTPAPRAHRVAAGGRRGLTGLRRERAAELAGRGGVRGRRLLAHATCACAGAPRRRMLVRLPRSACECGSTALLDKHASGRPFSPPRCQASPKGQCTSSAARRCRAPARAGCARAQALGYWSAP